MRETLDKADSKARELGDKVESLNKRLREANSRARKFEDSAATLQADLKAKQDELAELNKQAIRERQKQENNTARGLKAFWTAREDYYRALHRGIGAEQGSNLKRLLGFRRQSLLADLDLISALGGSVVLREEALSLGDHAYDGAKHQWYNEGEDPAPNGAIATVYLPGWTFGEYHTKASLGAKERSGG
jgi:hypothetical protein